MNPWPMEQIRRCSLAVRGAFRLAAAALTGCQGGRCVRTHDFAPALDTAYCNVDRCVVVSVPNEATPATLKLALRESVSFVHPPALMTSLRGMGRIDLNERHAGRLRLVGQKQAESAERPRMQRGPLGLAKPYPLADPRQVFNGDTALDALSLDHDAFTYLVVDVGREARLLSSPLFEQSARRTGFFSLQPPPDSLLSFPVPVQSFTRHTIAVASGRDVYDTHIDSDEAIDGIGQRGLRGIHCGVEKPLTIPVDQIGLTDRPGAKQNQILWSGENSDTPQPTLHSQDRDGCVAAADDVRDLPGQTSRIERLGGTLTEANGRGLYLHAAPRTWWTIVAGNHVGSQSGIGVGHLADYTDRWLCRQPEPLPQLDVEVLLRISFVENSLSMHPARQPRRRTVALSQCGIQRNALQFSRQYAYFDNSFHIANASECHRQLAHTTTAYRTHLDRRSMAWWKPNVRPRPLTRAVHNAHLLLGPHDLPRRLQGHCWFSPGRKLSGKLRRRIR